MILLVIKIFSFVVLPVFLAHLFSKFFYDANLLKVLAVWVKFGSKDFRAFLIVFGLAIVIFFLQFIFVSSAIEFVYKSMSGVKNEVVYLGHSSDHVAVFYDPDRKDNKVFEGVVPENPNTNFMDVNKTQTFIKALGEDGSGIRADYYNLWNFIALLLAVVAFSIPFIMLLFYIGLPYHVENYTPLPSGLSAADEAISRLSNATKLNIKTALFVFFGCLILAAVLRLIANKDGDQSKEYALPMTVRLNDTVWGVPSSFRKLMVASNKNRTEGINFEVDSGTRKVVFKFTEGFEEAVYVSLSYQKDNFPEADKLILQFKEEGKALPLSVDEKLQPTLKRELLMSN